MILLDTHIWVWWVHGDAQLTARQKTLLEKNEAYGLGVSVISCWEVVQLTRLGKLALPCPVDEWLEAAIAHPGVRLIDITPPIAEEAKGLLEAFHQDLADQIIVATARLHGYPLLTADPRILDYPDVIILQ